MLPNSPLIETHDLAALSLNDVCIIETDMTRGAFDSGRIPGTLFWPLSELMTPGFQLKTDPAAFASLLERSGITPDTLVVCSFNGSAPMAGWAPWLFWILSSFGHEKMVVLNGGTPKWRAEGRPLTAIESLREPVSYPCPPPFKEEQRADLGRVREAVFNRDSILLDARTEAEYNGDHFFDAPPKDGEKAGRIPGAIHLPHMAFLNEDGTYLCTERLHALMNQKGIGADASFITYCAVGIRSATLWFALMHLLGYPRVRNYDGSWTQWSRSEFS
jgi:thiosulfate/3-mercaptopyruvate sulfurtransferase